MIKSDDALTEIQFSQPVETVMRMLMYQFKLTKSQTCFYQQIDKQILYKYRGSPSIGIFFPYKHPARKKYVTLGISCIQAIHFQFFHNHWKSICFQERALTRSRTNVHYLLDSCHVTAWSMWHMTFWVGSSHSSHHPAKFMDLALCESEDKIFLTFPVATQFKCHVTSWVHFPRPKSQPC